MPQFRFPTEPPTGREVELQQIVDAIDPDPGFFDHFPTRSGRSFRQYHPYDWVDDEEVD